MEQIQFEIEPGKNPNHKKVVVIFDTHPTSRFSEFKANLHLSDNWLFYGRFTNHKKSFFDQVDSINSFFNFIHQHYEIIDSNIVAIAKNEAAIALSSWIQDYAGLLAGCILAGPSFKDFSKEIQFQLVSQARAIACPTLILSSGQSGKEEVALHTQFFKALSSEKREHYIYTSMKRDVFFDAFSKDVFHQTREFIQQAFQVPWPSYTLSSQPVTITKKRSWFKNLLEKTKLDLLRDFAQSSEGLRLGFQKGFTSLPYIDHVETGKPEGAFIIGQIFDWLLLKSQRSQNIQTQKNLTTESLKKVINYFVVQNQKIKILSTSSRSGRVILEMASHFPDHVQVTICDHRSTDLLYLANLAQAMNLKMVEFINTEKAMDLSKFSSKAHVVVIDSAFHLNTIKNNFETFLHKMEDDAFLIYSNELSQNTQFEVDQIFRKQGFVKTAYQLHHKNRWSISVAQRKYLQKIIPGPKSSREKFSQSFIGI